MFQIIVRKIMILRLFIKVGGVLDIISDKDE